MKYSLIVTIRNNQGTDIFIGVYSESDSLHIIKDHQNVLMQSLDEAEVSSMVLDGLPPSSRKIFIPANIVMSSIVISNIQENP